MCKITFQCHFSISNLFTRGSLPANNANYDANKQSAFTNTLDGFLSTICCMWRACLTANLSKKNGGEDVSIWKKLKEKVDLLESEGGTFIAKSTINDKFIANSGMIGRGFDIKPKMAVKYGRQSG